MDNSLLDAKGGAMKHYFKELLFIMICTFFSYSLTMEQPFREQIKSWPDDRITRKLKEIDDISEQMNGVLSEQLAAEERVLRKEQGERNAPKKYTTEEVRKKIKEQKENLRTKQENRRIAREQRKAQIQKELEELQRNPPKPGSLLEEIEAEEAIHKEGRGRFRAHLRATTKALEEEKRRKEAKREAKRHRLALEETLNNLNKRLFDLARSIYRH